MSVPAVRRVVVGVDGSSESVAALRWACREASLRGAEVHVVHVREEFCHSLASYAAVPALTTADDISIEIDNLVHSVKADLPPEVEVRGEVVNGLAARVLLDRCEGADMLVLGTSSDGGGEARSAGPGIRAGVWTGPAPRVLLDRCEGADMLVLGTSSDGAGESRSAGPVIRACLRRASCPVVVISAAKDPVQHRKPVAAGRIKVPAGV